MRIRVSLSCLLRQLLNASGAGAVAGLSFEPLQVSQSSVGFPKTLADWEDWPMEHRTGGFRLERKRGVPDRDREAGPHGLVGRGPGHLLTSRVTPHKSLGFPKPSFLRL